MQEKSDFFRKFRRLSISTIIAVYLLILVGGIVRSTGSGMGCPNWPKCFGSWLPPTNVAQLPPDYKNVYSEKRHQKNQRLAKYLAALGLNKTADRLMNDPTVRQEADFSLIKSWIEYLNRMVGVVTGLLITATFFYSIQLRKVKPTVFWLSALALIGVIFQGWVGSIVVSTNLLPGLVSFHMLLALLIVLLLIGGYYFAINKTMMAQVAESSRLRTWLVVSGGLFLIQVVLGIQVREGVDRLLASGIARSEVIQNIGVDFVFHRSFSWAILATHLWLAYRLWKAARNAEVGRLAAILCLLVIFEIITGAAMGYFSVPAFVQPVHLLVASIIFGFQVYLFLMLGTKKMATENVQSL